VIGGRLRSDCKGIEGDCDTILRRLQSDYDAVVRRL
jgi:hypothetical protein